MAIVKATRVAVEQTLQLGVPGRRDRGVQF
jgi:hypothetical protein